MLSKSVITPRKEKLLKNIAHTHAHITCTHTHTKVYKPTKKTIKVRAEINAEENLQNRENQ